VNKNLHIKETLEKIISKDCSIQVFGLGYVGFPLSIRLAKAGFKVTGVDTDLKKSFLESIQNGNFVPSTTCFKTDRPRIGIICVPTPIPDGKIL